MQHTFSAALWHTPSPTAIFLFPSFLKPALHDVKKELPKHLKHALHAPTALSKQAPVRSSTFLPWLDGGWVFLLHNKTGKLLTRSHGDKGYKAEESLANQQQLRWVGRSITNQQEGRLCGDVVKWGNTGFIKGSQPGPHTTMVKLNNARTAFSKLSCRQGKQSEVIIFPVKQEVVFWSC